MASAGVGSIAECGAGSLSCAFHFLTEYAQHNSFSLKGPKGRRVHTFR